jgi:hypothetical protein
VTLYAPQRATRVRWNMNTDTPLPADEPRAPNPPEGALVHYRLAAPAALVQLEVLDSTGALVRRQSSDDPPAFVDTSANIPRYWIRPELRLATAAGVYRFAWDLHWATPAGMRQAYPIAAVPGHTVLEPRGPWALPGTYRVRLTVDGTTHEQSVVVRMDPRVREPRSALIAMHSAARAMASTLERADSLQRALVLVRRAIGAAPAPSTRAAADSATAAVTRLIGVGPAPGGLLASAAARLATVYDAVEDVDRAPTTATLGALGTVRAVYAEIDREAARLTTTLLPALNAARRAAGQIPVVVPILPTLATPLSR